jgi:uncharacterized protein (DUF2236 family)
MLSGAVEGSTAGDVADRFQRVTGSAFVGLFAAGLFDQAMLPAVSAALEDTGRIRNTPWLRALRTAASDQIIFAGEESGEEWSTPPRPVSPVTAQHIEADCFFAI